MLSASHWLLPQAQFCGRTHLPLSPNSTTPTVQVIFQYLRPDAPVFNITTVGMVTFRQSPCWYYPWTGVVLSTSSDTQHLWTWWHFGDPILSICQQHPLYSHLQVTLIYYIYISPVLRINFFYLLQTFCPHLGRFCCFFFTMFRPNFTSGLLQVINHDQRWNLAET